MGVAFFVSLFRSTKEADMADSIAVDSPVDVGINEMFRQLRSAKRSHVADKFIGK